MFGMVNSGTIATIIILDSNCDLVCLVTDEDNKLVPLLLTWEGLAEPPRIRMLTCNFGVARGSGAFVWLMRHYTAVELAFVESHQKTCTISSMVI